MFESNISTTMSPNNTTMQTHDTSLKPDTFGEQLSHSKVSHGEKLLDLTANLEVHTILKPRVAS